ncbi:transporter substrate-binding domain-containing protein [Massilia endophytica]|uniref:transporter substrate-binding domain-containing protein n=1 Tax=Massilia endophytica TaxID=2899220 RepID=UPI001E30786A|nr:transporter substrate-binding domain-containing protein [Massilia endophytica]UGQ48990.1 transporter substrate-binding domain-containing protein [Massilia endophytica]
MRKPLLSLAATLVLAAATVSASAADLLATVKARGTLKVAMEGTYPPFNFKDQKTGQLAGYDVDVAHLVAKKLGVKAEFVATEWSAILAGLASNKYDVIVSQVTIQPKRELAFDFTIPYTYSAPMLILRQNDTAQYKSLAELKGKRVGVGQGSIFEQQAKAAGGIDVRSYPAAPENLADLAAGRIDAALNDSLIAAYLLKTTKLPIRPGAKVGQVERVAIALRKGNPEFKAALNKALAEAAADGSLSAIAVQWFGTDVSKAP